MNIINLIKKLPLSWQHKIRYWAIMAESYSEELVVDRKIVHLIENTPTPNFEEFDKQLNEMKNHWKIEDDALSGLGVTRRFTEFKDKHQIKKEKLNP